MTLIIAFSMGSYIFLNTGTKLSSTEKENIELQVQKVSTESTTLPDIQVTKKVVEFAKKLLPVSQ